MIRAYASRRTFLMGAAATAASSGRAWGANERINLAVIGLGGRGSDHLKEYLQVPLCRVAGLCDIDSGHLEKAETSVYQQTGSKPKTYRDMRQVFDDKDIDAVSIVVPNHWHALAAIWACQAGKDVYSEKPACHNIFEGKQMVAAARKYNRVLQVGHQSRSIAHKIEAMQRLHEGVIGKVYLAKGLCYKRRLSIGRKPDGPVPTGVDWDMFLGPAPKRPFNPNRFHYNWHWFWDTGNGDIGNQGVHEMDVARWGLNQSVLPASVVSSGGKWVYDDDQETPNTQTATFDYGSAQLQFEVRGLITGEEAGLSFQGGNTIGNLFYGSEGYMAVDVEGYRVFLGDKHELRYDEKFRESKQWDTGPHIANFLAVCRSRKMADLHDDIEVGRVSASLCHMANISYRLGRKLLFDPSAETFVADTEANKMSSRNYRAPYVVPENI